MEKKKRKAKAERLCRACMHRKDVNLGEITVDEDSKMVDVVEFYCGAGHSEPNFECSDFEPTKSLVRNVISELVEDFWTMMGWT